MVFKLASIYLRELSNCAVRFKKVRKKGVEVGGIVGIDLCRHANCPNKN